MLVVLLVPAAHRSTLDEGLPTLANLFLVHSWVPFTHFFFSFNGPSWSIATELAFYLCFPLLVWSRRYWKQNLRRTQLTWPAKQTGLRRECAGALLFLLSTRRNGYGYGWASRK